MARTRTRSGDGPRLDPEGHYSPEDLVVASDVRLPGEGPRQLTDQLPVRELVYRIVEDRGPTPLPEVGRELARLAPRAISPPYLEQPDLYVLRVVAGGWRQVPPLATFEELVRLVALHPAPDPDYGLVVRPA